MTLALHPDAARALDMTGSKLLHALVEASLDPPRPVKFKAGIFAQPVDEKNIVGEIEVSYRDGLSGEVVEKRFTHEGRQMCLRGRALEHLRQTARKLQARAQFRDAVSVTFLIETIFRWVKTSYKEGSATSLSDYVTTECEAAVKPVEVWIPIAMLHIQEEFNVGKITLKTVTTEMLDHWERVSISANPRHEKEISGHFAKERKRMQGCAAGVISVVAEADRATETAFAETEKSLAVLRAFSPAVLTMNLISYCVPSGLERIGQRHWLIFDGGEVPRFNSEAADSLLQPWLLTTQEIRELRTDVLDGLSEILRSETRTQFEETVLSAIGYYSRSALCRSSADQLVYVLVALESVLLRDEQESIQQNVGERLAFAIGRSAKEREQIIGHLKMAYKIRSRFLHHGREPEEIATLREFLMHAWKFFFSLGGWTRRFRTRDEFLDALEHRKLS